MKAAEFCGEVGSSVTERVFPNTQRIAHQKGNSRLVVYFLTGRIHVGSCEMAQQKTPATDSARAFCNARRSQVNESSLTRNEI